MHVVSFTTCLLLALAVSHCAGFDFDGPYHGQVTESNKMVKPDWAAFEGDVKTWPDGTVVVKQESRLPLQEALRTSRARALSVAQAKGAPAEANQVKDIYYESIERVNPEAIGADSYYNIYILLSK